MGSPDTRLITTSLSGFDPPLREIAPSNGYLENERDPSDYVSAFLKRKWLILTIVVVVTTAATIYTLNLPPIYESSAVLQLDTKEYIYLQDSRGSMLRAYNNDDYQNTQIHLLRNPHLIRQVVLKLNLERRPGFLNEFRETSALTNIRRMFSRKRDSGSTAVAASDTAVAPDTNVNDLSPARISELEPYVAAIAARVNVQPIESTNLVTVSMTHKDPQIATEIIDTLAKTFISNSADYENKGALQAAETLGRQISEVQTKIREAEEARLEYLRNHDLPLEKGEGRNLTADRLGKLSSQLLDAENDRKLIEATYEAAKASKDPVTVPAVRDSDEIKDLRKTINQLEQKRASLLQSYTPEWPEVKKVDSEIRQLKYALARTSSETVTTLKAQLDAAAAREAKLREAYYKERAVANVQTQDEIALGSFNQQIDINRQVYNILLQRQTEMQVNAMDKSSRLGIVTPAVVPSGPIGPTRVGKILTAFVLSLMAGLGLAFVINQLDNTLKSAEDVAAYVSLPTLALIPSETANGHGRLKSKIFRRSRNGNGDFTALALTTDRRSPTAEAYRHLLASLLFTAPGRSSRTILVTSGNPLEGKTTVATSTAITFAQSGAEVLLIDCDLRRPRLHRQLDLDNVTGLTTYLSGGEDIESLIVTHELYPNLKIITAGPIPANPADFLGSTEMRVLVKVAGERFDHVVIDSPPASSFADASIIATLVDGVVIVAHSKRSSRRSVRRVKQRLEEVGANVYGVVLNEINPDSNNYYSEYYSSYED